MFQRIVFFLFLVLSANFCKAQSKVAKTSLPEIHYNPNVKAPLTIKELEQIKEVYGEFANKYVLDHPERLRSIKNILRNRVIIQKNTETKYTNSQSLFSSVTLFDSYVDNLKRDDFFNPNTFNPLKYNFEFYSKHASVFRVDNTNYIIIIKSQYQ